MITRLLCIGILALFSSINYADADLLKNPEVQQFIDNLVTHQHFKRDMLESVFLDVQPMPEVVHHMKHPAEAFPWDAYQRIFVTPRRIEKGAAFAITHNIALNQVEKKYHIPSEIIVAILGVESNYGTHTMKYRAIDALTHLAFNYPERQKFFMAQLTAFLELTRQYHLNINDVYGSYAGAIGPAQFMPDSILHYAIITNSTINLNDPANWLESIANFFSKKGWKENHPIVTPITCPKNIPQSISSNPIKHFYTPQQLKEAQISDHAEENAMFLELNSHTGPQCWLAYHNFSVIMRYNTSPLYAMAVVQLSEKLSSSFGKI